MTDENCDSPLVGFTTATTAVGELIKAAGDAEEAKAAGRNLGKAAVTLTGALNNLLLPLAAVNYAFDRARRYFDEHFNSDLAQSVRLIPDDCIIEPKASLAGPAIQGLAFSHEEPDLKQLYLELLATAMDSRSASNAHPAFVEVIKQLAGEEARLLKTLLPVGDLSIARVQLNMSSGGKRVYQNHVLDLRHPTTGEFVEVARLPSMIDNWIRLGLVQVDYMRYLTQEKAYEWVEQRPEFLRACKQYQGHPLSVSFQRGMFIPTDLGIQFARATGIVATPHVTVESE